MARGQNGFATPEALDLNTCYRTGGPFATFVHHLDPDKSNLVLALALPILLANLIFGNALFLLTKLCDKEELYIKRRSRAALISIKIDEHLAAYNRREVLRVHQMNHANAKEIRQYVSLSDILADIKNEVPTHKTLRRWLSKCEQIERELSMQASRVDAAEMGLRELSRVTWTEKMFEWLAVPGAGIKLTARRCGVICFGSVLFLFTVVPVVLGPYIILAHEYCDQWTPPQTNLTTAFWIIYGILTVLPAAIGWRMCMKAIWHWTHAPCVQCIEAPNIHSEHIRRTTVDTQFSKDLREGSSSEASDATSISTAVSPTSPIHRCGSPTDLCRLSRISEDVREDYEEKIERVQKKTGSTGSTADTAGADHVEHV